MFVDNERVEINLESVADNLGSDQWQYVVVRRYNQASWLADRYIQLDCAADFDFRELGDFPRLGLRHAATAQRRADRDVAPGRKNGQETTGIGRADGNASANSSQNLPNLIFSTSPQPAAVVTFDYRRGPFRCRWIRASPPSCSSNRQASWRAIAKKAMDRETSCHTRCHATIRGETFILRAGQFDEAGRQLGTCAGVFVLEEHVRFVPTLRSYFLNPLAKMSCRCIPLPADARSPSLRCEPGPSLANRPPPRCTAPTRVREGIRYTSSSNQLACRNSNAAWDRPPMYVRKASSRGTSFLKFGGSWNRIGPWRSFSTDAIRMKSSV